MIPASTAYFGAIPKEVMTKIITEFNQSGRMPLPAVLINGKVVSYGVPKVEDVKTALLQTLDTKEIKEEWKNYCSHSYSCVVRRSRLLDNDCLYRPHSKPLGNVWPGDKGRRQASDPPRSKLVRSNINPNDAKGVFQRRLNSVIGQMTGTFGGDVVSTPCMEEMATFDQFVTFLEEPDSDVIVFDTAPTGKTLRELAMPFDWAGFLQKQIQEGKKLAKLMNMDSR